MILIIFQLKKAKNNYKIKKMSVNKIILIGNTTQDPSIKTFEDGNKVATFGLAMNERGYTLKNGTQVPERTEFVNLVVWKGLAEVVEKYVKKGSKLYIEGKIRTRTYDDKGGVKRYVTEIHVDNLELLGAKEQPTQGPTPSPDGLPF